MVIGDPYRFSVLAEVIEEWNLKGNIPAFRNGIFFLCIEGNLFPKQVVTATLNVDISFLKNNLKSIAINEEIFNMEKEKAFLEMYNTTFPEGDDNIINDYRYDISPPTLSDNSCFAFAVSNGKKIRVMAAELNYQKECSTCELNSIIINEAFIMYDELKNVILQMNTILESD